MRTETFLLALTLLGCARLPATMRPATDKDMEAVGFLWEAWRESGREVPECPVLDHVRVSREDPDTLIGECGQPPGTRINACVTVGQMHPFDFPGTVFVHVDATASQGEHLRLVIHEAAHVLRACWVDIDRHDGYLERYRTGERADCHVRTGSDPYHCDTDLWRGIVRDAWRRMEQ